MEYSSDIEVGDLRLGVGKLLNKEINDFSLFGAGLVNHAYYVRASDGVQYIVKVERSDKEFQPQNDLLVEAKIAQQLYALDLSIPTPHVVFVSEHPKMYGYEYVDGDLLKVLWNTLSEDERISICNLLGHFHVEIGKKFTEEMARTSGVKINESVGLHPDVVQDNNELLQNPDVPEEFKILAKQASLLFETTKEDVNFQFIHNDSHHENILMKNKKISGIIDFGEAEYGEIAKEFSRYIRDFPNYFGYIVAAYEEGSGNKLSRKRLITNAFLSGFSDMIEDYRKGGEERVSAEHSIATYRRLLANWIE